jgi:hypothetical protein
MKKAVTIQFDEEKLKAARFYAGKKNARVEAELDELMQKIYEKYVPAPTREYIESQTPQTAPPPRQRPNRAERPPANTANQADGE